MPETARQLLSTAGLPRGTRGPIAYRGQGELWDFKDRYQAWMLATGYAETTRRGAHNSVSWFLKFLDRKGISVAGDLTPEVLEEYAVYLREPRNGLSPAPRALNYRINGLKQFFLWLRREGFILYDAAEDLERPRLPEEVPHVVLTEDEVFRLLNAPDLSTPVGYRDRAALELTFASGIRSLELRRLKIEAIDYRHRLVNIKQGKGNKDRCVPVPGVALEYVREYVEKIRPGFARTLRKDDGTLFLNYTGAKLTQTRMCEIFADNRRLAGLDKQVTAMTLRHSVATLMLESGMDSRYIQAFLGHQKLSTTQVYTKITLGGLKNSFESFHPMERGSQKHRR